jgi:TonB family protein
MASPVTPAARRRILHSLLISGGVHVSAVSLFLLGVSTGWLPEPYATQSEVSSVEFVASVVSDASAETEIEIRIDVTSVLPRPLEYREDPQSNESLFPTKAASICVQASWSLAAPPSREGRLLEMLTENREQVVSISAPIAKHPLAARRKIKAQPENLLKPLAADPPPRNVGPREISPSPALSQVAQVETRDNQGAELDRLPTPVFNPAPVYPADALTARREGRVILRAFVDQAGEVSVVKVWRSSGSEQLDQAAMAAVREWKFTPGQRMGQNAAGEVAVPVVFQIAK